MGQPVSPSPNLSDSPLASGSQEFDLSSVAEQEYRRRRRQGRRFALLFFVVIAGVVLILAYLVGDFTPTRLWEVVAIVLALALGTGFSMLTSPRNFRRIVRLTIDPARTWFADAKGKEFPIAFDSPHQFIVFEEPASLSLTLPPGGALTSPPGHRVFATGLGFAALTPEAMAALRAELERRGLEQVPRRTASKPNSRTVITAYASPRTPQ